MMPFHEFNTTFTLRFVHRHCKGWFHWELSPCPFKRELSNFWKHHNPRNEDSPVSSGDFALKDFVFKGPHVHQLCAIAEAFTWVEISEKHQQHSGLEVESMRWKSIRI